MVSIWWILGLVTRSKRKLWQLLAVKLLKQTKSLFWKTDTVTNKSLEDLFKMIFRKKLMKKSPSKMLKLESSNPSYQFMKTQLISYWGVMMTSSTVGGAVCVFMEVKENESEEDVMNTLEKCYSSLNFRSIQMILTEFIASGYRTLIITRGKK